MITVHQWLWIGVVHEAFVGLVFAWLFWWYIRVPYSFELGSQGAKRGFWESLRWLMALTWLAYSLARLYWACWLVRYLLTQPIPA